MADPTRPLHERSPDEISEYLDDHLLMALHAAEVMHGHRQFCEDYVRDRLVALSDSFPDAVALAAEERRRRMARLSSGLRHIGIDIKRPRRPSAGTHDRG